MNSRKHENEDFGDVMQKDVKPSFSLRLLEQMSDQPIKYKSKEDEDRIERLQRFLWCTSYDAAVMPSHMAEQQQTMMEEDGDELEET